jgi:hypothetical protein
MPFGASLANSSLATLPFDARERRLVGDDVRQIENLELLDAERTEFRQRGRQHLHGAELQRLKLFLVLVERRIGKHLDLDLSAGIFLRQLLEFQRALPFRSIRRHHMTELDDDRLLGIGLTAESHRHRDQTQQNGFAHQ